MQNTYMDVLLNVLKNKNAVIIYLVIIFKQINSHIYFLQLINNKNPCNRGIK